MPVNDLYTFISLLESNEKLSRISAITDPHLEIAAITNRVCKQPDGGRALLFEQPKGSIFPVTTNLFGSIHRTCLALGVENLDQLTIKMTALLDRIPEFDLTRLDLKIAALPEFSRFAPLPCSPCWNEVMELPDLTAFPFLQSWPGDGAADGHPRYITLPQVVTADPDGANPNCGIYGAQVRGKRELALRWKAGSGAARHLERFRQLGQPMPVAIALGGPPAALFSAMLPLPGDLDEMTFAGFLRGKAIEMSACRSVPLRVPATAEVVIEGFVDPSETVLEGPFGNHTGSYSPSGPAALLRVTSISHRPGAIIPATVVGPPPMEDCWMAKAWERLLLAFLKKLVPAVADIHFPLEWVFHQSAMISLEKPNPAMVREIAARLWDT
jgi:4-hydroxy-3-polyprenylbenzoate decarboxylase